MTHFYHEYDVIKDLGKGSFGSVIKARNKFTGIVSAVKIIDKNRMKEGTLTKTLLYQEIEVVQQIEHPCIMRVFDVMEDADYFYISCELLCEELSKRLLRRGVFSERDAAIVFQQVLMALNYLHLRNIVHRDIKLENVLMQTDNIENLNIKITDFGFAKISVPDNGLTDVLGSPLYMAPEIILKKPYGTAVDIWAAGVMLHVLVVGEPPFVAETKNQIFEIIKKQEVKFRAELWSGVS